MSQVTQPQNHGQRQNTAPDPGDAHWMSTNVLQMAAVAEVLLIRQHFSGFACKLRRVLVAFVPCAIVDAILVCVTCTGSKWPTIISPQAEIFRGCLPTKFHEFITNITCAVVQIICQNVLKVRGAAYPIHLYMRKAILVPQIICKCKMVKNNYCYIYLFAQTNKHAA